MDDFDFSWTDDLAGYYDSEGNYLGDDMSAAQAAAESWGDSWDDSNLNPENWAEAQDDFGEVWLEMDNKGNVTGAKYRDENGKMQNVNLDTENAETIKAKMGFAPVEAEKTSELQKVSELLGTSLDAKSLQALSQLNDMDKTSISNAYKGSGADAAKIVAITGLPIQGGNLTQEQKDLAYAYGTELGEALKSGVDQREAIKQLDAKYGDPYGTTMRDHLLTQAAVNTVLMFGPTVIGSAIARGAAPAASRVLTAINGGKAAVNASGPAAHAARMAIVQAGTRLTNGIIQVTDKAGVVANLINTGLNAYEANKFVNDYVANQQKQEDVKTAIAEQKAAAEADAVKKQEERIQNTQPEVKTVESAPKEEKVVEAPKTEAETKTATKIEDTNEEESESSPIGTTEEAEERGFSTNNDSSIGDDNFEQSSTETTGLGLDTFANPNIKEDLGLGEENPNRASYDSDKWNRGMEKVSTNVVSDEKCKSFILKTFKDDPVLIETVRLIRSRK